MDEVGDHGSGLCIELDLDLWPPNPDWIGVPVEYVDQPPGMNVLDYLPCTTDTSRIRDWKQNEFIRRAFLVKARDRFEDEQEVRIIWQRMGEDQRLPLPKGMLQAVSFGRDMRSKDREFLVRLGQAAGARVVVEAGFQGLRF